MKLSEGGLDLLFQALGDPTRRAVLERLGTGPASVSALHERFDMALPSFVRHLRVLEDAGLVVSEKRGRVRTVRVVEGGTAMAEHWLAKQRKLWETRLDQLDRLALTLRQREEESGR